MGPTWRCTRARRRRIAMSSGIATPSASLREGSRVVLNGVSAQVSGAGGACEGGRICVASRAAIQLATASWNTEARASSQKGAV
jgi:hypothetical protein